MLQSAFINDTLVYLTTIKTQRHNSASRLKCMKYDPANDTFLCISNDILIDVQPCIIPIAISIDGETAITTSSEECIMRHQLEVLTVSMTVALGQQNNYF